MAGVEPAQLTPLPPQDSVSTNSTTSALYANSVATRIQADLPGCIYKVTYYSPTGGGISAAGTSAAEGISE